MGPNLYITPPASFTHFHQDGHGTVDSGHLCLAGFNEVVMLKAALGQIIITSFDDLKQFQKQVLKRRALESPLLST